MSRIIYIALTIIMIVSFPNTISAQSNSHYIRIAKLVIDSTKLEDYNKALKEHAEAAVKVEAGVIMLYAVYEKAHPANVTVFEIYADEQAYNLHIQTPHFLKYKTTVQHMVQSLS